MENLLASPKKNYTKASICMQAILFEYVCHYIKDANQQTEKYNKICMHLHQSGVIDDSWMQPTAFESLRNEMRVWLQHLLFDKPMTDCLVPLATHVQGIDSSYYSKNFKEVANIGHGGFGKVFKAKHNLDEVEYAIKKVSIRSGSQIQFLNEVKTIATLNHPNIVQYKTAWFEMEHFPVHSAPLPECQKPSLAMGSEENSTSDVTEVTTTSSSGSALRSTELLNTNSAINRRFKRSKIMTLYIQMSLCRCNLHEWLWQRHDNRLAICKAQRRKLAVEIFVQLLRAFRYIHSKNIIHHDVKPDNIFISDTNKFLVQLGDFGLACPFEGNRHDFTGTRLYAAPEQLLKQCTIKSDIYSLGIVLYELLQDFGTNQERYEKIRELRKKASIVINDVRNCKYTLDTLVLALMRIDPTIRPGANDLLKTFELHRSKLNFNDFESCFNEEINQDRAPVVELKIQELPDP